MMETTIEPDELAECSGIPIRGRLLPQDSRTPVERYIDDWEQHLPEMESLHELLDAQRRGEA